MEIKITNHKPENFTFETACALDLGDSICLIAKLENFIEDTKNVLKSMGVAESFMSKQINVAKSEMRKMEDKQKINLYGVKL